MLVCHCQGVSDRKIRRAIRDGATTPGEIASNCGAGSTCGGCAEGIRDILGTELSERGQVIAIVEKSNASIT